MQWHEENIHTYTKHDIVNQIFIDNFSFHMFETSDKLNCGIEIDQTTDTLHKLFFWLNGIKWAKESTQTIDRTKNRPTRTKKKPREPIVKNIFGFMLCRVHYCKWCNGNRIGIDVEKEPNLFESIWLFSISYRCVNREKS